MLRGDTYMELGGKVDDFLFIEKGKIVRVKPLLDKNELVWDSSAVPSIGFAAASELWLVAWETLEERHGGKFMQEFWAGYASKEPYEERWRVMDGVKGITASSERSTRVKIMASMLKEEESRNSPSDDSQIWRDQLCNWLLDCIENKDAAALRGLASSFKDDEDRPNSEEQSDPQKIDLKPRLLYSFCELLQKNKAIPTRVELEKEAGIDRYFESGEKNYKNVAPALRALGLSMLVEGD